jgi:hypothetical protein
MTYWHNYADESGSTHFVQCNLTTGWVAKAFGSGQPVIYTNTPSLANATGLTFFYTPYGIVVCYYTIHTQSLIILVQVGNRKRTITQPSGSMGVLVGGIDEVLLH